MGGFVGRARELHELEQLYAGREAITCVLYGRKRLGKSALLKEFCKDKRYIYISAAGVSKSLCYNNICEALGRFAGEKVDLKSIDFLFDEIIEICGSTKTVLIMDDYSELMNIFPSLSAQIKPFMRNKISNTNILFIICDEDASLSKSVFSSIKVEQMSYLESKEFHKEYSDMDNLKAYGIAGGTPAYHFLFQGTPEETIRALFLDRMSVLTLEAESMINAEMVINQECSAVMSSMALGADTIDTIAEETDISRRACGKVLDELVNKNLAYVKGYGFSKKPMYSLSSNLLRFYYAVISRSRFLPDFYSENEAGVRVSRYIKDYMELVFKDVCEDFVKLRYKRGAPARCEISYARNRNDSKIKYVDFVLKLDGNKTIVPVFCRLYGEFVNLDDAIYLEKNSSRIAETGSLYLLFSGCGFSGELVDAPESDSSVPESLSELNALVQRKDKKYALIGLEDIYKSREAER